MSSFSTPLPFLQTWAGAGGSVILHKIFWLLFNLLKSNERKKQEINAQREKRRKKSFKISNQSNQFLLTLAPKHRIYITEI